MNARALTRWTAALIIWSVLGWVVVLLRAMATAPPPGMASKDVPPELILEGILWGISGVIGGVILVGEPEDQP